MDWRDLLEPTDTARVHPKYIDTIDKKAGVEGETPLSVNIVKVSSPSRILAKPDKPEIVHPLTGMSTNPAPAPDVEVLREFAEERLALGYSGGDTKEEAARQAAFLSWAHGRRIMVADVAAQMAKDSEPCFSSAGLQAV